MLAPEAFAKTHTRHVTNVIRVALEQKGVIGFIDVYDTMTLAEARAQIWENVENAPAEFQFVLDDGAPVSARQENSQKIAYFYPMVRIRELRQAAAAPNTSLVTSRLTAGIQGPGASFGSTSEKVCVSTASGEEFHVWVSEDYTFQQLRRDAARYWNLSASQVALADREGCLWPEQAKILSLMSLDELRSKRIVLQYKGGALTESGLGVGLKDRMGFSTLDKDDKRPGSQRTLSISALSLPHSSVPIRSTRASSSGFLFQKPLSSIDRRLSSAGGTRAGAADPLTSGVGAASPSSSSSSSVAVHPVEELWRIFTFYCANGDSMELECLKAHQFNKLLRDSRVVGGHLTPAMVDIIYTSETKGKPQASGKMNYEEFLNALVKVARATQARGCRASSSASKLLCDSEEEDALFQRLVLENILPLASRWPTSTWEEHTQRLRRPEIVSFISKFLEPLLEMFMFYAKSHLVNASSGVKEFYMSYTDYQRFINDFCFANLQLSSVEAAHVFLAACSSPPFHAALFAMAADKADRACLVDSSDATGSPSTGSSSSSNTGVTSIQRILESVEGVVAYAFPENQVGRMCMGVSAFLDALGRTGLTALSKTRSLKTIHCVKGVFHHLSRGLTRSRVLEILQNHRSTSMHATKFYSGSVAFNNKFLDMWRYEGSPDYLTGDMFHELQSPRKAKMAASTGATVPATTYSGTDAIVCGTGAPFVSSSRRVLSAPFSSTSLFVERGVSNGSGRGREALDRLVRKAFLRNAMVSSDAATKKDVVQEATLASEPVGARALRSSGTFEKASSTEQASSGIALRSSSCDQVVDSCAAELDTGFLDSLEESGVQISLDAAMKTPPAEVLELTRTHAEVHALHQGQELVGSPARIASLQGRDDVLTSPLSPLSKPALRQEDERSFFQSILLKGGVFKKYGQWGNPHRRFVWCSKDLDAVYWRSLNKKSSLAKDAIPVASMLSVLPGNSSRTRYAFMKHLSDEKCISRCFSVVAEDRRLDLEADSEATQELWTSALTFLIQQRRAPGLHAS